MRNKRDLMEDLTQSSQQQVNYDEEKETFFIGERHNILFLPTGMNLITDSKRKKNPLVPKVYKLRHTQLKRSQEPIYLGVV